MQPLASDFLVPKGTLLVPALVMGVVFVLLVLWPLVETVVRQQWGYALGVVFLGPIGGLVWFAVGRRASKPSAGIDDLSSPHTDR